jgi:hypothetical protein
MTTLKDANNLTDILHQNRAPKYQKHLKYDIILKSANSTDSVKIFLKPPFCNIWALTFSKTDLTSIRLCTPTPYPTKQQREQVRSANEGVPLSSAELVHDAQYHVRTARMCRDRCRRIWEDRSSMQEPPQR